MDDQQRPALVGQLHRLCDGTELVVRRAHLFGDRVEAVEVSKRTVDVTRFETVEAFREYFKLNYGPTVACYRSIADDAAAVAALDQALVELGRRFDSGPAGAGGAVFDWEYLLVTARRADRG